MAEPFIGEIRIFGGNYPPRNWALCDGSTLDIAQHTSLFSIISDMYGGNGRINFGLPDLRGRAPMGHGMGPGLSDRRQGHPIGQERASMDHRFLPAHKHTIAATNTDGDTNTPDNTKIFAKPNYVFKKKVYGQNAYADPGATPHNQMAEEMVSATPGGAVVTHENRQPFLSLIFIIALDGLYPSRN